MKQSFARAFHARLDVWKDPEVYLQETSASQMHIQHYWDLALAHFNLTPMKMCWEKQIIFLSLLVFDIYLYLSLLTGNLFWIYRYSLL